MEFWITESAARCLALWNSASGEQLDLGRVGIPRGEPQRRKGRQVPEKKEFFRNITAETQRA